ncbi:MAG: ketoacyl-ACP synthase III [Eudoraea sp.]|nr:ketoacyl-ACP synthase III [Eudoraea sp.]MBT8204667.1 ketoacyl-ACP synthase III [Eudoraea sp.]MBT8321862.1 ketoacyl-ACP synthase III [Eudoraea sp.]NNJ41092.1 ketoacyl-ACP synthase III [Eudoraea sp.]NNK29876.1 ketoacyl-ACP synthase III [Flavobacteriaceae bacterium]
MNVGILGTGCYIPSIKTTNKDFKEHNFLDSSGSPFEHSNTVIIEKFKAITGIKERRYARDEYNTSDLGYFAAERAIEDAGIDPETLDYIIVAHNFGNVLKGHPHTDTVPSLATRVKNRLNIQNPRCVAYDLLFGCPGWVEGVIQAKAFIQCGMAKNCLIIGAETLSRVVDPVDRDSMIYSDGAGACVLSAEGGTGEILSHLSATYANEEAYFLFSGDSYNPECRDARRYIKMYGRKIYEFAISHVPGAMKECLEQSGVPITELKKIFLHQANEKMDEAIVKRFYRGFRMEVPEHVMPMNINTLGNSSVATIPTLFDMVKRGQMENHQVEKGDIVMFASVGAGMNINAFVYRC